MKRFLYKQKIRDIAGTLKISRNDTCYIMYNAGLATPRLNHTDEEQIMEDAEAKKLEKELRRL